MSEIIPAIIPKNFSDLAEKVSLVANFVKTVHVDINDGKFVKSKSWPHSSPNDFDFEKILKEEEGMPYWEKVEYEIHLMVSDPAPEIDNWIRAGSKRVLVHYESFPSSREFKKFTEEFKEKYGMNGSSLFPELGVVLKTETPIEVLAVLEQSVKLIDSIQLMSIATIGFQGINIPFETSVIDRVSAVKNKYEGIPVSVDGSINMENAQKLIDAGADRLIIGGAIFQSEDITDTIEVFKSL